METARRPDACSSSSDAGKGRNMWTKNAPSDERDRRLDEVVAEYLQLGNVGAAPAVPDLLKAHPDLAGDLAEFFAEYEQVERMTAPLRIAVAPPGAAGWEPP